MSLIAFRSFYLNSKASSRLVRYDYIGVDSDNVVVKVFDDQQAGVSPPHQIVLIDELFFTRSAYKEKYEIGSNRSIQLSMPPTFEGHIEKEMQSHRDKLN